MLQRTTNYESMTGRTRTLTNNIPHLSDITTSRTIMHEIHPTLQSHPSPLPSPQLYHSISKCFRRPLIITCPLTLPCREHRLVEVLGQVSPILVCHRPHCPNNTPESAVLHRSGQMQRLVRKAPVRQLCRVTSSKERKFRIRESRSDEV